MTVKRATRRSPKISMGTLWTLNQSNIALITYPY
jgi:hypothetical protein